MKKRRILSLLLCLVMLLSVFTLSACDSDPDAEKVPENTPTENDDNNDDNNDDTTPPADPEPQKPLETLQGKTIVWNGDSICYGTSQYGNWATRVAENNNMEDGTWKNYGVGGGTITEELIYQNGNLRHSVCTTLEKMFLEFPDADYVILEGGTNDADLLGKITNGANSMDFGSYSNDDFSGEYNTYTFCGALESIFYNAKELWPDAKICFIVAQKMGTNAATSNNRYAYFQAAMEICEKWEIPYLNLWDDCDLDPTNPEMYDPSKTAEENEQAGSMYRDGQHLTAKGYDYTTAIIEAWLKTL